MTDKIKEYALGNQDLDKYKKLITADKGVEYVNINWALPQKIFRHFRTKVIKRFMQSMKNYYMVSRLKNKTTNL